MAAATLSAGAVLIAASVVRLSDVASPIAGLIPIEMIEGASSTLRHRSVVAIARIVAIVYVTVEACATVVPGTSSDE